MSRVTRREWYRRVNECWPENVPPMTAEEGTRAARRLYRFVTGKTWTGPVKIVSGRRDSDIRRGVMFVSPTGVRDRQTGRHAWDRLVHDLSHRLAPSAGVDGSHGGDHARLERRMVKEVVDRGWLDGALKSSAKPELSREEIIADERATALARVDVLIEGWERRATRAANALTKLHRRRRAAVKKLDAPIPPVKERAPTISLRARTEALAKEHGITVERHDDLESRPLYVFCDSLEGDADPFEGDHYVDTWSEVADRVAAYVTALSGGKS